MRLTGVTIQTAKHGGNVAGRAVAPAVSIIMPAYQVARYIAAALDSVFNQTFTDYEIIIVNDGSPDTVELERALAPYRERITYIAQPNMGPSRARNVAIQHARGRFVALLDSDDEWLPDYLAAQLDCFETEPTLDLVYADALLFGDSPLAGQTFMQTAPSRGLVNVDSLLDLKCNIITTCVVAKRQSLIDAGLFDEQFFRCEDFDLWLRLAARGGRISYQQRVLARHRLHAASLAANAERLFADQLQVYQKFARTVPHLAPRTKEILEKQLARCRADIALTHGKQHFAEHRYREAVADITRANQFYRSRKLRLAALALQYAPRVLHRIYNLRRYQQHNDTQRELQLAPNSTNLAAANSAATPDVKAAL